MTETVTTTTNSQTVRLSNFFTDEERKIIIDTFIDTLDRPFKYTDAGLCDIDVRVLSIDASYRTLPKNTARHLKKNWNTKYISVIDVSYRDGEFYVVNGAALAIAAIKRHVNRLPALIHTDLTREDEIAMFLNHTQNLQRQLGLEFFKANLMADNETDMAIKRVCDKYGVKITTSLKPHSNAILSNVAKAREIVNATGENSLDWIFKMLKASGWLNIGWMIGTKYLVSLQLVYKEGERTGLIETFEQNLISAMNSVEPRTFYQLAIKRRPELDTRMAISELIMAVAKNEISLESLLNDTSSNADTSEN